MIWVPLLLVLAGKTPEEAEELLEDLLDAADARESIAEPGSSISLEQI